MSRLKYIKAALTGTAATFLLTGAASATQFNIPAGDLASALDAYTAQTGVSLLIGASNVREARTEGVRGDLTAEAALSHILAGTGFAAHNEAGVIVVVPQTRMTTRVAPVTRVADTVTPAHAAASVETVVVTSSKIKGDIQTVPIAITALSQEQLTSRQIAGGPDLVKEVPNLTFSKTNFTGYNIEIRGIGTQAISVTTDPAVAVAFNDIPFIRNHFFEQEFYDVSQVEVLRGPQGTLYGRNATAGVVNVVSAKPTDQFEAMLSADWGNYSNRRYEGMLNIPIVGDKLALRVAGEWTKRDGYTYDSTLNTPVDGRDLWSGRASLRWRPTSKLDVNLVWEHFSETDDRLRSAKTLCTTDPGPSSVDGPAGLVTNIDVGGDAWLSQGCKPGSLYARSAFGVPNPLTLPFVQAVDFVYNIGPTGFNPYGTLNQSPDLRVIGSPLRPAYRAKNDTLEFNVDYSITPTLTLTSQTGYNNDFLYSTEDFNRFNTVPGAFIPGPEAGVPVGGDGQFCDPQLGCSDRFIAVDVSREHAQQFYQELRLASNFSGPLNFSVGASYLRYHTLEDYFVFSNLLTVFQDQQNSISGGSRHPFTAGFHVPFNAAEANACGPLRATANFDFTKNSSFGLGCAYVDPNPLSQIDGQGHNYFRNENPYRLHSYAGFGEVYYQVLPDLKLTGGLRWTDDSKTFTEIPSWTLVPGKGYPVTSVLNQQWNQWTGRFVANWTPKLSFTDQSMFYASYAHGYKAGGANPPGVIPIVIQGVQLESASNYTHPLTFKPEFVEAFELGTKNTLLDGDLVLNGDVFYYNYHGYQISKIVDRTAINDNFNAHIEGAELETTWSPLRGLKLGFNGGYENAVADKGQSSIDLMDRTNGNPDWMVVRPFVTQTSNCILPTAVVNQLISGFRAQNGGNNSTDAAAAHPGLTLIFGNDGTTALSEACHNAYDLGIDPGLSTEQFDPTFNTGFDPAVAAAATHNGEGFAKNVGGNQLPNAPHFTASLTADYTMPVSPDWAATLHSDFYWQSQSFARIFNDRPYDKLRGYSNVNLALILTDASGWQVMSYIKNVFDTTAITGAFLNSDDTALATNVFTTDPRLYGIRITKNFGEGDWSQGGGADFIRDFFADSDGKRPPLWIEIGGDFNFLNGNGPKFDPTFGTAQPLSAIMTAAGLPSPTAAEKAPREGVDWAASVTFEPEDSNWVLKAGIRYGRTGRNKSLHKSLALQTVVITSIPYGPYNLCDLAPTPFACGVKQTASEAAFSDAKSGSSEQHAILDFTIGKDVGLGAFTPDGTSTIAGGVRMAQFTSHAMAQLNGGPDYVFHGGNKYDTHFLGPNTHDVYNASTSEKRRFNGIGPELTWDASQPVLGNPDNGQVDIDWGLNAALLFGRQKVRIKQHSSETHYAGYYHTLVYSNPATITRSRTITVPNLGAYAGASVNYKNAKVKFGYRIDEFFRAMDGGQDTRKSEDRAFYGPYLAVSIGLGG